jgi:hypothetical protein
MYSDFFYLTGYPGYNKNMYNNRNYEKKLPGISRDVNFPRGVFTIFHMEIENKNVILLKNDVFSWKG